MVDSDQSDRRISRRTFIKSAAIGIPAAIAARKLVGSGSSASTVSAAPEQGVKPPTSGAAPAPDSSPVATRVETGKSNELAASAEPPFTGNEAIWDLSPQNVITAQLESDTLDAIKTHRGASLELSRPLQACTRAFAADASKQGTKNGMPGYTHDLAYDSDHRRKDGNPPTQIAASMEENIGKYCTGQVSEIEYVAWGTNMTKEEALSKAMNFWKTSDVHRPILDGSYETIGAGAWSAEMNGMIYWTMVVEFGNNVNSLEPNPATPTATSTPVDATATNPPGSTPDATPNSTATPATGATLTPGGQPPQENIFVPVVQVSED